ncbi:MULTISPECIES: AZOBR_p60025 family cell surface glycopolymer formation protein [Nocardioides]|uniref:AZOBR_p60025 family cell surface glycopolymer formation protein n=1 Tax=Nocardioides vastitatis TaxID=2568655 RepID=A0ABW0ZDH2_9ACTN|nr:hypothetical protein [Nocardioides sp.]THJ12587.1 hypothetical protein E7Z54_02020 [Nocardioides sp.]
MTAAELAPRRTWPVVAAAAAIYVLFVGLRLAAFDGDPSSFMIAGDGVADPAETPSEVTVFRGVRGYDGQAYYRLSRDPLTLEPEQFGITFTRPAYWQTRIGYPGVVWLASAGGQAALVPWTMLLVNVVALLAMTMATATIARRAGRSSWWGLVPVAWGGYVIGIGQDLTEPLAGALLAGAVLAARQRRWRWAAVAMTAAALTRETSLILAFAVLASRVAMPIFPRLLRQEERPVPPWWVGLAPFVLYGGWRIFVRRRWADVVASPPDDGILGPPLVSLFEYLGSVDSQDIGNLALLVPTVLTIGLLAPAVLRRDGHAHERLALLGYLVVLACLPVWDRGQAYLRWCCEPVLLGWVLSLGRPVRVRGVLAGTVALVWLLSVIATVHYPGIARWPG